MSTGNETEREARSRSRRLARFRRRLPERTDPVWVVLAVSVALFVGFSVYMSLRYRAFLVLGADFGSYLHMFATTLDGTGFLQQGKYVASHPGGSYWGGHFSLTVLAFLPVYALFQSAYTLIVVKAALLAASVLVLWGFARDRIRDDRIALVLTLTYAFNPFLWRAWLFAFQEQVLLPVAVFGLGWAYARRRYGWFLAGVVVVAFTNEFVTLLIGGFLLGLAVAASRAGRLRREAGVLAAALGITVLARVVASVVIARFSRASGIPPASIARPLREYTGQQRVAIPDLLSIVADHPAVVVRTLLADAPEKAGFFLVLVLGVALLALADEATLGALAPYFAFAWLFAGRETYYVFSAHYALYLLPFVYVGAVRAVDRLALDTVSVPWRRVLTGALVVALVCNVAASGVVLADHRGTVPTVTDRDRLKQAAVESVPENGSVLTQNDYFPHLAKRPNATFIPVLRTFRRYQRSYGVPQPAYLLYDTNTPWSAPVVNLYFDRLGEAYGAYRHEDGIRLYKRGYNGPLRGITGDEPIDTFEPRAFSLGAARLADGAVVAANGTAGENAWFGPYTTLPPGNYTAVFRVAANATGAPAARVQVAAGTDTRTVASESVPRTDRYRNVTVPFRLNDTARRVEFRGFYTDRTETVRLRSVTVRYDDTS